MKQKIIVETELTFDELKNALANGSKFISFQYCISILFAITLRRFSPAYLVNDEVLTSKYRKKYNLISLIFGWWGVPWGPIYTIRSLNINKNGGIDVTEDIILNINEVSFKNREVDLVKTNNLFCQPDKWDRKAFKIALSKFEFDYNIKQLVVGLFINTEEGVSPFFTIGLKLDKNNSEYITTIKTALYTQFQTHTHFVFVDLNEENEQNKLLLKQGITLINR